MATVYTCFCTDVIHEGHLNIINNAQKYGEVVVGVMDDKASIKFNRFPSISFDERVRMVESIEGVSRVIAQHTVMYDDVIHELKPDYVIHGDNWTEGPERAIRENVIRLLGEYGGRLIELPYTRSEEVRHTDSRMRE